MSNHVLRRLKANIFYWIFWGLTPDTVIFVTVGLAWAWNWTNFSSIGSTWSKENYRNSANFELSRNQAPVSIFNLFHYIAKWFDASKNNNPHWCSVCFSLSCKNGEADRAEIWWVSTPDIPVWLHQTSWPKPVSFTRYSCSKYPANHFYPPGIRM